MLHDVMQKTLGEFFLIDLEKAESKGLMFETLKNIASSYYPKTNLMSVLDRISDFDAVAKYHGKLARLRIDYNAKAVNEIQTRLVGLNNFGEDNYKYKDKIIRKLNLLINSHPTIEETLYIAMSIYMERGWGRADVFKRELAQYFQETEIAEGHNTENLHFEQNVSMA